MGAKDSFLRERAQKCRIGLEGRELHGMARHDLCPRPNQLQGGVVLLAWAWPSRVFPQTESGTGLTNILVWRYFFRRYGQLEKTRPGAIASPPSALSQMPKADENDCRLGWPGGLRTPQVRVFEVYRYRNQNACLRPNQI
jgi:hypothetical protein